MQKAKIIFYQTVMISAAILFGIGIQMILQHYISGTESLNLSWNVPISICLTGFLCSLPTYFLLDLDSLKKNVMWMRIVIHFISVGGIVVLCGYLFDWYGSLFNVQSTLVMYSIIYIFVWFVTAWIAKSDEIKINAAIKDMQDLE
ncbi:DUF3021 family protein [uncultured Solobacterium sp.]|uniref:DUF3021 family protein n=1 Tax=uncultured Solobacterium sp. TaxID=747375 RepID=UPI0028D1912C|nr:DUF3021 family protein [uncultured Solobacterium sp.]